MTYLWSHQAYYGQSGDRSFPIPGTDATGSGTNIPVSYVVPTVITSTYVWSLVVVECYEGEPEGEPLFTQDVESNTALLEVVPDPPIEAETTQIRRLRITPTVSHDGKRVVHKRLQIEMQPGIGATAGLGQVPQVLVRASNDGGLTWSSAQVLTPGSQGQYQRLMRSYAMGSAYNRTYEIVVSDPVPWCIVQGWLDIEGGTH
jgi:hypothetical protein